jgi:hypothetical protein
MGKPKRYWLWIDGKPGIAQHELQGEIDKHGFTFGRSTGTWGTALSYLRDYMKAGFIVRVYEVEE